MIAALEWVPAGVAAENPKKYEMNAAEKEVLKMLQEQGEETNETVASRGVSSNLPETKNDLPADLRMDEYSDDEEGGAALGNLLVLNDEEGVGDSNDPVEEDEVKKVKGDDDMDSDDDDDELEDVPDTREYMPLDVEGLEAMGLGDGGFGDANANDMFADDDSDAEDVRITPDDAVMVVAKTEEVRLLLNLFFPSNLF